MQSTAEKSTHGQTQLQGIHVVSGQLRDGFDGGSQSDSSHTCTAVRPSGWKTYSLRNSVRVRCCSDALLSSSADWARLRKPKTLHGYSTTSDWDVVLPRNKEGLKSAKIKERRCLQTLVSLVRS